MRSKKGDGQMMQDAIDKASQLIQLLQKENRDVKKRMDQIQKECEVYKKQNHELQADNEKFIKKTHSIQERLGNAEKQLQENHEAFTTMEESLKKRIHANKELHQKMALLSAKLKEKTREIAEQKRKGLSLENENQYLLKKFTQNEQKQNDITQKINCCSNDRERQLKEAIRLKEAFARRCEELKVDNEVLIQAAAEYKQKVLYSSTVTDVKPVIKKRIREDSAQPSNFRGDSFLTKLIKQKLGINPGQTPQKQYEQLSSFIEYRLAHLDKLWQSISSKIVGKDSLKVHNLKDLHVACQRVHAYISELVNRASQ